MSRSNGKIVPPMQRYTLHDTKTVRRKRKKRERGRRREGKREIDEF